MSFEAPPPEFFLDRNLGTRFAQMLRNAGWAIHRIADVYEHDAQLIADEAWIEYGCQQGWALLTKDARIRYRAVELGALSGAMFCLANGNLRIQESAERFLAAESRIFAAATRGEPGLWSVYENGRIERKWP